MQQLPRSTVMYLQEKSKELFYFAFLFLSLIDKGYAQTKSLYLYQVDPLEKVLKDRTFFTDNADTIRVAKGETATIQIVVKANKEINGLRAKAEGIKMESSSLTGEASWVGYVGVGRSYNDPSKDLLRSPSNYFPDPLLKDTAVNLQSGEVQPIWIIVPIPEGAVPGVYKGTALISGKVDKTNELYRKEFFIKVYPVTVPKPSLWISNWMNLSPENLAYMNGGKRVERFTPLYWQLLEKYAAMIGSHGQNVKLIDVLSLTTYTLRDSVYSFDFKNFDREAEIFERYGALDRIEGGHLAYRYGSDNFHEATFYAAVPLPDIEENRKLPSSRYYTNQIEGFRVVLLPIHDPRTKRFLNQFLPALKQHLEKKGWLKKYVQHIADEPVANNSNSYLEISSYVKKYLPNVKIIDAVLTSKQLSGGVDIWVPQLDVLDKDYSFYKEHKKNGGEVWFYTCIMPQGNYANRFIELPLIQMRYLHWINFKYDITGYLHWALNMWYGFDNPFLETSRNRGKLPGGDSYIIYPGYHKLHSSIRFEAMRDGIHDYELLKKLQAKNPQKAKEYTDAIIIHFKQYDGSIKFFRTIRKEMLELLSR